MTPQGPDWLLDRHGDARPRDGHVVVSSEREFLVRAGTGECLQVRGKQLCSWAEAVSRVRGIPLADAKSPQRMLLEAVPTLSESEAAALAEKIGDRAHSLSSGCSVADWLDLLFPSGPWRGEPGLRHAAEFLLWIFRSGLQEAELKVVLHQVSNWARRAEGTSYGRFYCAADSQSARELLEQWLGLSDAGWIHETGQFPLELDERLKAFVKEHAQEAVHKDPLGRLREQARRCSRQDVLRIFAEEAFRVVRERRMVPRGEDFSLLERLLPWQLQSQLRELSPPNEPSPFPESFPEIVRWYAEEYLPYRQWQVQHGDDAARRTVAGAARAFAEWLLRNYAEAMAGGPLREHLAIRWIPSLGALEGSQVRLVILLDGLNLADCRHFVQCLCEHCPRLSQVEERIGVAPIPTVTSVAKDAILFGVLPRQVAEASQNTPPFYKATISDSSPISKVLEAPEMASNYLWISTEPDRTYHKPFDSEWIVTTVRAHLDSIAKHVSEHISKIPDTVDLEIAICTDHGRMLGSSRRSIQPPRGMQPEGRAAFGQWENRCEDQPYSVEQGGSIAVLFADSYGLEKDACVILDDVVFRTDDGRGGEASFPHGGIYPEEVLIAWVRLLRDAKAPKLRISVSGRGVSGATGKVNIHADNLDDVDVVGESLVLSAGAKSWEVPCAGFTVQARQSAQFSLSLKLWPSSADCRDITGRFFVALPSGRVFPVEADVQLESSEIYKPEGDVDVLNDL